MSSEPDDSAGTEAHLATLLKELEKMALARGMCMVAHFIRCARMTLEEEAAQFSPGSNTIN